jgi:hypothetical protein
LLNYKFCSIYKLFITGGIWINLGPLLYHFADMKNETSIEPSYDVLREIIIQCGFQMEVSRKQFYEYLIITLNEIHNFSAQIFVQ